MSYVSLKDGSLIVVQNQGSDSSENIRINSSDLEVSGGVVDRNTEGILDPVPSAIITESIGNGKGGNIEIYTEKLFVNNGGQIQSTTFGENSGGDISIKASNSAEISNFFQPEIFSSVRSATSGLGDGGKVTIDSRTLLVKNGGSVNTTTLNSGNAGDLDLNISELTSVSGFIPDFFTPSSLTSVSLDKGDSGNVNLNTSKLNISDGGSVSSLAVSSGNSGLVEVNASEMIQIKDRISQDPILASAIASSAEVVSPNLIPFFALPPSPTGNAGSVIINTPQLSVMDGGIIAVRNTGTGNSGELTINTDHISLDNGGEISASTVSGEGGNIALDTESLKLFEQSNITASAQGQGNGGNITIDSETLLGLENSDITANAIAGNGGNIEISSDFIFGLESRPELTPFSDITASSELGIDGTVTIFSPESNIGEEVIIVGRDERALKDQDLADEKCSSYGEQRVRVQDLGSPIAPSPFDFPYSEDLPREQSPIADSSPAPDDEAREAVARATRS